ncbi:hypothetical protein QWY84_07730 [Aquisalimonas lutea]|uniref:hypothetical protein n=1 Tax=Aquisalimonas lutea TaxID=1327750 RepID=UPI0025B5E262|nr:hypothetical protein [Aquisalimonas lutea]MDN3517493.1 hypothetical protein [Aquisalimonas lutea]
MPFYKMQALFYTDQITTNKYWLSHPSLVFFPIPPNIFPDINALPSNTFELINPFTDSVRPFGKPRRHEARLNICGSELPFLPRQGTNIEVPILLLMLSVSPVISIDLFRHLNWCVGKRFNDRLQFNDAIAFVVWEIE